MEGRSNTLQSHGRAVGEFQINGTIAKNKVKTEDNKTGGGRKEQLDRYNTNGGEPWWGGSISKSQRCDILGMNGMSLYQFQRIPQ